jgi:hypothetical protein
MAGTGDMIAGNANYSIYKTGNHVTGSSEEERRATDLVVRLFA